MPNNLKGNIEVGAQVAIAIAMLLIAGVVVKRNFFPTPAATSNHPQIESLNVPGVDWQQNHKTLVFFLMKDCVYCKSSAPLYRELIEEASKRGVKLLAILPNRLEQARAYVRSLDLPIEDVRSGPLSDYQVSGTPTVLFVDAQGKVRSAWFGAAPGRDQQMRDELVALFDSNVAGVTTLK
ncbi:MAG TPA: redoxin domain-containing protein [Pyrinomonadaceae bacterium]|jgi:peroxiredoxin